MNPTHLFSFLLFFTALNVDACPNFSGKFNCPAYGSSQPASVMIVTQSEDKDRVTTYSYTFDIDPTPSDSKASPNGLIDDGMLKFCSKNRLYLGEISGANAGTVQTHFIDDDGAYVVILKGKVVQKCTKFEEPSALKKLLERLGFKKK